MELRLINKFCPSRRAEYQKITAAAIAITSNTPYNEVLNIHESGSNSTVLCENGDFTGRGPGCWASI